jgi:hypothetical protein
VEFYETDSTSAKTLFDVIRDVLLCRQLNLDDCRRQCYDGASNMSGRFSGARARICAQNPKAFYVHCCNHSLNLALEDSSQAIAVVRDTLQYVHDLNVIVRSSPKRLTTFEKIRKDMQTEQEVTSRSSTSLRPVCPTRWSLRMSSVNGCCDSGLSRLAIVARPSRGSGLCAGSGGPCSERRLGPRQSGFGA